MKDLQWEIDKLKKEAEDKHERFQNLLAKRNEIQGQYMEQMRRADDLSRQLSALKLASDTSRLMTENKRMREELARLKEDNRKLTDWSPDELLTYAVQEVVKSAIEDMKEEDSYEWPFPS